MQGTECWGRGGGSSHPPPLGSATVPFLNLKRLKCNDDPVPPLPRAACPATQAVGPSRQGLGATPERPAVASPNSLGDQIYLMVKRVVPNLTARASERARGPATRPRTGPRAVRVHCRLSRDFKSAQMFLKGEERKVFFFPLLVINDKIPSLDHCLSFGTMFRREQRVLHWCTLVAEFTCIPNCFVYAAFRLTYGKEGICFLKETNSTNHEDM